MGTWENRFSILVLFVILFSSSIVGTISINQFAFADDDDDREERDDDISDLNDDELIELFQDQLNILEQMGDVLDEAALIDVTRQKITDLKNKVNLQVDDEETKQELIEDLDSILEELDAAEEDVFELDESDVNDSLADIQEELSDFIEEIAEEENDDISSSLADELINDATEISSDLEKRDRDIIPVIQSFSLPSAKSLIDRSEIELQILRDIFAELENRDVEIEFGFERDSPAIGVIILNAVKITVSGADAWSVTNGVNDALEAAGKPRLNEFEYAGLFLINSSAFFGLDSVLPNPSVEAQFVIELTKSIFGVVNNSDFIIDTYIPVFTEALLFQEFLVEVERDIIISLRSNAVPKLTVIKFVDGGPAEAANFVIHVIGNNPNPALFLGVSGDGTPVELGPGAYEVTEDQLPDYTAGITNDCTSDVNGPIRAFDDRVCVITNTFEPPPPVIEGLVAHWNFDEGQGTTLNDVSSNGKNGNVVDATWVSGTSCKSGNCLNFDGSGDHVNLPTIGISSENDPYTVSAWVEVRHNNSPESAVIIGNNDATAPFINQFATAMFATTDDRLGFIFCNAQIWCVDIRSDVVLMEDTLYHVAATYDGSRSVNGMKIYIDGIQPNFTILSPQDPEGDFGGAPIPIDNWNIGKLDAGSFFDGIIDELRIYDRALTDAEILQLSQ